MGARLLDALVLLLPFAVLYWLRPGAAQTIGNDYGLFSIQAQMELQLSMAHGSFPLFVHGWAGGRAASGITLGQTFHPLTYLAAHSPGYWRGLALECNTFWRLVSLGVTQLCLLRVLRRAGLRADLAFVASFLAVYNLRMLDMFRYGASLENYTGLLLLCAAMLDDCVCRRRRLGPLGVVVSTYLLACGGHPQMAYLGFLAAGIVLLAIPFVAPALRGEPAPSSRAALSFYARTAGAMFAGVLLASAYLVPFYVEFVRDAPHRTTRDYDWAQGYADSLKGALNSFFAPLHADVHGAFGSSVLAALAVSAPFALAPAPGVPGRRVAAALALGLVAVFLCTVGGDAPVHHWFWAHVPLANSFRVPGRVALVLPCLLLLLSAWTFSRLERAASALQPPTFVPASLVGQVSVMFGVWSLLPVRVTASERGYTPAQIHAYPASVDRAVLALGAVTLALAAVRFSRWRHARWAGVALAAVVAAQATLELRHGTWVEPRRPTPTFFELSDARAKELKFTGEPGVDMESAIQLDGGRPAGFVRLDGPASAGEGDSVVTTYAAFNRMVFSSRADAAATLALAIPFAPQWRARVDGRPSPVAKSKWNEVEVAVPAGLHEIEVRFESPASRVGMGLSCLTLAAVGIFAAGALDRRAARAVAAALAIAGAAAAFASWQHSLYTGGDLGTRYSWPAAAAPRA